MKLAGRDLARFLHAPEQVANAVLVYGPDQGLVGERVGEIVARVAGDPKDPFRVCELTAAQVKEDPVRLADEAAALSLSGGRRVLRLREAVDALAEPLAALLEEKEPAAFLVVEAGDLARRSSLRALFERLPKAAAIACYLDDEKSLGGLIADWLKAGKLTAEHEAVDYLMSHLGGDRGVTRQELEKLALHADPATRRVTLADAMAVVGDSSALTLDDLAMAAAGGDAAGVDRSYARALSEGSDEIAILRAAARHLLRLHRVAGAEDRQAALKALRPPVFFKVERRFLEQVRLWPTRRLAEALDRLNEAETLVKTSAQPKAAIVERALLQVAELARGRA